MIGSLLSQAQSGERCGNTQPSFCVGEKVIVSGYPNAQITGVMSTGNYTVSGAYFNEYSPDKMGKTKGCGTTTPRFCAGEKVTISGYPNATVIGVNLFTGNYYISGAYYSEYSAEKLGKTRSANPNSPESLNVYLSTDTQDIVQTYQALASVTTKERSDFLTSSSAYLTQLNSEDVNIMAGMVIVKIIRLSTSSAVKENFQKPAVDFIAAIEKNNWKSLEQIEANSRTLDFATRVVYAAVKLKLSLADSTHQNNADLAELGRIATTTQLSKKLSGLQAFCESHRFLVDEMIQDPRHGVLGMTTADIMGWVMSK